MDQKTDKFKNDLEKFNLSGIGKFSKERRYQIEEKGFTAEFQKANPQFYSAGQLGYAARELSKKDPDLISTVAPTNWDLEWWSKARLKPFQERLIIAGALMAAYYDYEFVD